MKATNTLTYESPEVEIIEIEVEQGFGASSGFGADINGWEDGDEDYGGEVYGYY